VTSTVAVVLVALAGCGGASELTLETDIAVEETAPAPEAPKALVFSPPTSCVNLLPEAYVEELAADGIELVRAPEAPVLSPFTPTVRHQRNLLVASPVFSGSPTMKNRD